MAHKMLVVITTTTSVFDLQIFCGRYYHNHDCHISFGQLDSRRGIVKASHDA
jgi:hypothetical protein